MLGSVAGSAPSTGCFLLEHLRERVGQTEGEREKVNTDENKDAKQNAGKAFIFNAK